MVITQCGSSIGCSCHFLLIDVFSSNVYFQEMQNGHPLWSV